jgi:SAM-dependent methyltransferase
VSRTCAVCGSSELRLHLQVATRDGHDMAPTTTGYGSAASDIIRCQSCGHMQLAEMPSEPYLDETYGEIAEVAYLEEEAGQRATAVRALERIERHVRVGALCDLGCWVGFLLSEAEKRGWKASGVEPSEFAADYARTRLGLDVQTATIGRAELLEGGFDAVAMGDVIEHLPVPGRALERTTSILREGGVVYLALPDAGSAVARRLGARWWSVIPPHVHYFTRTSIARLLARHGFAVEWMGTAPKAFSLRYYLGRLEGYSPPLASGAIAVTQAIGVADRLVAPDFRDRMEVVARKRES